MIYQLKSTLVVVFFGAFCLIAVISSFQLKKGEHTYYLGNEKSEQKRAKFEGVDFYSSQNNTKKFNLNAQSLMIIDQNFYQFMSPKGAVYNEKQEPINFESGEGVYDSKSQFLELAKEANLKHMRSSFSSRNLKYDIKRDYVEASGGVESELIDEKTGDKFQIKSITAYMSPSKDWSKYQGNVIGKLKKRRAYQEGVDFLSNTLEIDLNESLVKLDGEVEFKRRNFNALANSAEIYLENYNKKLKYYQLLDDIRLKEWVVKPTGEKLTRKAFAEKMEGYESQRKIILSGAPRVLQGRDIIKGTKIVLREDVELVEVEDSSTSIQLEK